MAVISIEIMEDEIDMLLVILNASDHVKVARDVSKRIVASAVEVVANEE